MLEQEASPNGLADLMWVPLKTPSRATTDGVQKWWSPVFDAAATCVHALQAAPLLKPLMQRGCGLLE